MAITTHDLQEIMLAIERMTPQWLNFLSRDDARNLWLLTHGERMSNGDNLKSTLNFFRNVNWI